jgi:hypothetical protein
MRRANEDESWWEFIIRNCNTHQPSSSIDRILKVQWQQIRLLHLYFKWFVMNWATQQFGQLTPIKCLVEIVRLFFQGTVFHMIVQLLMSLDTVLSRGMIVRNRHAHPSYARYHALTAVPKWARRSKLTGRSADRAQRGGMSSGWWTFWWLKIQYFCTISFTYCR